MTKYEKKILHNYLIKSIINKLRLCLIENDNYVWLTTLPYDNNIRLTEYKKKSYYNIDNEITNYLLKFKNKKKEEKWYELVNWDIVVNKKINNDSYFEFNIIINDDTYLVTLDFLGSIDINPSINK